MILEKDYEVPMEAATIEDRTQFAKAYAPDDDLALVHAIRSGDVAAFEQLVKRYDSKLLWIAQNVTHNSEDAEEAVQEAFFKGGLNGSTQHSAQTHIH